MATTGAPSANISEQFVREAPDIEAYKLGLMKSAQALQAPTLPDYKVAGMTDQQTAAIKAGQAGIGAYVPYLQGGAENVMGGAGAIGEAADILRGADTRKQFEAAQEAYNLAAVPASQIGALANVAGSGMGNLASARNVADVAAAGTLQQTAPIGQQQIQQYMNPYTNLVIGQQLDEMNRQAMMQQQGLNSQAVKAGAFGGSRQGIAQQELNRNLMQTQNQAIAQALQQNYGQGLSAAQQQQQAGMAGYNQLANIGQNIGSLAGQYSNIAGQQANILNQQSAAQQNLGQGIGSLAAQQYGIGSSMAQGLGSLGSQLGNMGVQQAALGQQAQALGQNDTNFLYNLGAQQQKQSQAVLDAQRSTEMQNAMQPYQQIAFQSDIYKGAPSTQMSMTQQQTPQPSPFQQITGVGTGILGLAGAGKATGVL
jgi:hypothetical protein